MKNLKNLLYNYLYQNSLLFFSILDISFNRRSLFLILILSYITLHFPLISLDSISSGGGEEVKFKEHIHYSEEGPNEIGYIYIGDHESSISESTWLYVKQALNHFKKKKPIFIILELDTPGGEVFAAQKISDALKEMDSQLDIPVVTFINNWAISAGAMLAYSSRFITVIKDGIMGAAEPVLAGETGEMVSASEKVNSAIRADFASRAQYFGRNPIIAEGMVDKNMIIVWRDGKAIKLDSDSQMKLEGSNPDLVISAKGKLLTLTAEELLKYGVADLVVDHMKLQPITAEEKQRGEWPLHKTALGSAPFFSQIPQAIVTEYKMDWKTAFFVFLATPLVSSLLFMGLMIGGYVELNHPGFGLPGIVALSSLFLIILSYFSLDIANWLELIFLLIGLALILVEIFILPTFGFLGIIGILLFLVGLFGVLIPGLSSIDFEYDTQTVNAAGQFVAKRLAWIGGSFLLSLVIIALLARYALPAFSGFNRFVLKGHEQDASKGYVAGLEAKDLPQIGAEGTVLATLRPAGKIVVDNKVFDAISTGDFIEAGEVIRVVRLEGSDVIVNRKINL